MRSPDTPRPDTRKLTDEQRRVINGGFAGPYAHDAQEAIRIERQRNG